MIELILATAAAAMAAWRAAVAMLLTGAAWAAVVLATVAMLAVGLWLVEEVENGR